MKIGLLGHGTIGVGVDRIIKEREDMEITKILSLIVDDEMTGRTAESAEDITRDPEIDTVVEVMGGVQPAFDYIADALSHKKNVVTANKAVVAACYDELLKLAEENGVSFRSTAAVGGSIPWLVNIERAKRVNAISEVSGIMNGTTNFILHKMLMEKTEFDEVLKEAQDLGYAEKDPTADIDGLDIRRKVLISANIAFGVSIKEEDIPVFGIRYARLKDIEWGQKNGFTLKLLAYAKLNEDGTVTCFVQPVFVPDQDVMASIPANYNLVQYTGSYSGIQGFIGEGAGRFPTAQNVVEDLVDILAAPETYYTLENRPAEVNNREIMARYYIRTKAPLEEFPEAKEVTPQIYLTEELPVSEMLAWAQEWQETDPELFIAQI